VWVHTYIYNEMAVEIGQEFQLVVFDSLLKNPKKVMAIWKNTTILSNG
jgi:hypothetical protein